MICKKCGTEYEGRYCTHCGAPADGPARCPACGAEVSPGSRFCGSCGQDLAPAAGGGGSARAAAVRKKFPAKKLLAFAAVVVALAILVTVIVSVASCSANIFRIGKVDKIAVGDTKERVVEILGQPYDDNGGSLFEYYDDEYKKLLERSEGGDLEDIFGDVDSEDDFEDAIGDLEDAFTVLHTTEYRYISVTFDSDGLVREVFFDAARTEMNKDMPKLCKKYDVVNDSILLYAPTDIVYTARFEDGSFFKGIGVSGFVADNAGASHASVQWADRWENRYSASVRVKENPDILSAGELGEGVRYSLSKENVLTISGGGTIEGGAYGSYVLVPDRVTALDSVSVHLAADVTRFNAAGLSFRRENFDWVYPSIQSVSVAENNPAYTVTDGCIVDKETGTRLVLGTSAGVVPEGVKIIGSHAFRGSALTEVHWNAAACESLEEEAFYLCENVRSVTFGEGVQQIPSRFLGGVDVSQITEIALPDSVTYIDAYAFSGFGIQSVTVPENVEAIGIGAFDGCEQLGSILWEAKNCTVEQNSVDSMVFSDCGALEKFTIGGTVQSLPGDLFSWQGKDIYVDSLGAFFSLTIDERSDGWDLYVGGSLLTEYTVSVSDGAFDSLAGCASLQSVAFADGVTSVAENAFSKCTRLQTVSFPDSLTEIGISAFFGCTALQSVDFPVSLVNILRSAFWGCTALQSVVIPANVENIYQNAFSECTALKRVEWNAENCQFAGGEHDSAFAGSAVQSAVFGDGVLSIPEYLFRDCAQLESVDFGNTVQSIGKDVFYGCESLHRLVLPSSLTTIKTQAFQGASGLTEVYIPNSVSKVGGLVFYFCDRDKLTVYCEAESRPSGWKEDWNEVDRSGWRCEVVWGSEMPAAPAG